MPTADVEHEVRIAVVMYGGISLAVYMNGVAHELLEFVRATNDPDPAGAASLSGTARVYRKLARALGAPGDLGRASGEHDAAPLTVRFVVDIVSGTSAGGINAAMLAKALVRNASLEPLKRLWIENGALEKLINDRASPATRALYREPVKALFNSDYMYLELLEAMNELNASAGDPLVDDLSLAITGTDLAGRPIDLRLEDRVAREYAHKHTFDFAFSRHDVDVIDDFTAAHDPLLAFAARTTSSMPAAFEPTQVQHAKKLAGTAGAAADWGQLFRDVPERDRTAFETQHAFADGGYLDNKPFGHAIDRLSQAEGGVQVTRKLFYLEPLPQHIDPRAQPSHVPNALENTVDVFTLARYETIRADLRRIDERNRLIERLRTLHAGVVEDGLCRLPPCDMPPSETPPTDVSPGDEPAFWWNLDRLTERWCLGYGGYHRLRVASATDDLATTVADYLRLPEHSDLRAAIRLAVGAWRRERYHRNHTDPELRETAFLARYDLRFHRRRAVFMLGKINQLLELDPQVVAELKNLPHDGRYPTIARIVALYDDGRPDAARADWEAARPKLHIAKILARRATYAVDRADDARLVALLDPLRTRQGEPGADPVASALLPLLAPQTDADRAATTLRFLEKHQQLVGDLADALAARCQDGADNANKSFADMSTLDVSNSLQQELRDLLRCYWDQFLSFDVVQFPILTATGIGEELSPVGVHRISATDPGFYGSAFTQPDRLRGARYAHFGAFLDKRWREHDIRWGRLDGAERLIGSLLGDDRAAERDALIAEAHVAILREELPSHRAAIEALTHRTTDAGGKPVLDVARTRAALEAFLHEHESGLELSEKAVATDLGRLLRVAGKLAGSLPKGANLRGFPAVMARFAAWLAMNALACGAAIVRWLPLGLASPPSDGNQDVPRRSL